MKRALLKRKKRLLNRIDKKTYEELLDFVADIYLSDYPVKILMARKFSNLFHAILPFVQEEQGGLYQSRYEELFPDSDKEPLVISNRAIETIKQGIQRGHYKKILLADDIVIHGRTMCELYEQLEQWFKEAGISDYQIDIVAFAMSENGILQDREELEKLEVRRICKTDEWRALSNMIVDIFFILGQPYTSYVPNCRISKDSEIGRNLSGFIAQKGAQLINQTSEDMTAHCMKAYTWVETSRYSKFSLGCTMRIYDYDDLNEYVVVPTVLLKPLDEKLLQKYYEILGKYLNEDKSMKESSKEQSLLDYQMIVYVISALWGYEFAADYLSSSVSLMKYDQKEELMNFRKILIQDEAGDSVHGENILRKLNQLYQNVDIDSAVRKLPGVEKLECVLEEICREYKAYITENISSEDKKTAARIAMGKLLWENGLMDEERCRNGHENHEEERLMGYPLVKLASKASEVGMEWIPAVLYAIDFGKGSIVPKRRAYKDNVYYFSVLHAGEQNYKYYVNNYFPVLYGLYCLERENRNMTNEKVLDLKKRFLEEYWSYWEEKQSLNIKGDKDNIQIMQVSEEFGKVLEKIAWDFFDNPDLNQAMKLVKEIR